MCFVYLSESWSNIIDGCPWQLYKMFYGVFLLLWGWGTPGSAQGLFQALFSGFTLGGLREPYRVLRWEPKSPICEADALPVALLPQTTMVFLCASLLFSKQSSPVLWSYAMSLCHIYLWLFIDCAFSPGSKWSSAHSPYSIDQLCSFWSVTVLPIFLHLLCIYCSYKNAPLCSVLYSEWNFLDWVPVFFLSSCFMYCD